jgi:hypothetical protein
MYFLSLLNSSLSLSLSKETMYLIYYAQTTVALITTPLLIGP